MCCMCEWYDCSIEWISKMNSKITNWFLYYFSCVRMFVCICVYIRMYVVEFSKSKLLLNYGSMMIAWFDIYFLNWLINIIEIFLNWICYFIRHVILHHVFYFLDEKKNVYTHMFFFSFCLTLSFSHLRAHTHTHMHGAFSLAHCFFYTL